MIKIPILKSDSCRDLPWPSYMSDGASAVDLYAAVDEAFSLAPGKMSLIPTGISVAIPLGYELQIRPRSGLAAKHAIGIVNAPGTIDSDYRGEIKIILMNHGDKDFCIARGDRIAQMALQRVERLVWEPVQQLDRTVRADGGFGHTGVSIDNN